MVLSARPLDNVASVNTYDPVAVLVFTSGDGPSLHFQLLDLSKDRADQGFTPAGRRYMPGAGATLQIVLDAIDDAKVLTKTAFQPFAQDPSIWRIDLMPTDTVSGSVTAKLLLTENGVVRRSVLPSVLRVRSGL